MLENMKLFVRIVGLGLSIVMLLFKEIKLLELEAHGILDSPFVVVVIERDEIFWASNRLYFK